MLSFETVDTGLYGPTVERAKVPGGWIIVLPGLFSKAVTFYPDPNHEWDGSSLPHVGVAPSEEER